MKVQPCAINNSPKAYSPNFKGNRSTEYFAHMADSSDDDVTLSIFAGTAVGAISATKNFKTDFIPNSMKNVGILIILMQALRTAEFFAFKDKNK